MIQNTESVKKIVFRHIFDRDKFSEARNCYLWITASPGANNEINCWLEGNEETFVLSLICGLY